MDERPLTQPELLALAPKQRPQDGSDPVDRAGHALVAMLREAANISNESVDRATSLAHKLAMQLRAAEERIVELQGEVELLAGRATHAEHWLETIKQEIEDKLIAPMQANRPELPVLH